MLGVSSRHPRRSPTEHKDRVTGVAWSPLDEAVATLHFASGSADGTVKLWAIDRCAWLPLKLILDEAATGRDHRRPPRMPFRPFVATAFLVRLPPHIFRGR